MPLEPFYGLQGYSLPLKRKDALKRIIARYMASCGYCVICGRVLPLADIGNRKFFGHSVQGCPSWSSGSEATKEKVLCIFTSRKGFSKRRAEMQKSQVKKYLAFCKEGMYIE